MKGDNTSTIRSQLTRIVLIPSLCFLALWLVVAAAGTVQAVQLMGAVGQAREGTEVFSRAAEELREERRQAMIHLGRTENGEPVDTVPEELEEQRTNTDSAVSTAVALADDMAEGREEEFRRSVSTIRETPDDLTELRDLVDGAELDREQALLGYGDLLDGARTAITALVHSTDGGENLTDAVLTGELLEARADHSAADALLAGVIAAGEMSYEETAHFTYLTASYRDTLEPASALLQPEVRERYEEMSTDTAWLNTEELSRRVVTRPPLANSGTTTAPDEPAFVWNTEIDVSADEWEESSTQTLDEFDTLVLTQADRTIDLAWRAALLSVSLGVAAGALTLAGGITAIAVVGRSSRQLTGRLTRLRAQILDRDEDLSTIIDRAQRGGKVDVQEELPPLDEDGDDEIGQVAEACDSAQLAAVEAAVKQAEIRRGANRAFLGIAFRNQNLVQRQLRLLDEIEYNEQDPEALRRLFLLDHLVTRARRYADNLIILGGGQSVRRRRPPRPLVDVLRAAIAETEDFGRVRLVSAPRLLMHGQVVADVVHLLAELVENATQFSPAGTPVEVSCTPVAGGLAVEVEDRGLGMSERGYATAEHTLSQPSEFDAMVVPEDPRLGLFVVSRLSDRHGIEVQLRPSPYGGTRATVHIPETLLEPLGNTGPIVRPSTATRSNGATDTGLTPYQVSSRPPRPTGKTPIPFTPSESDPQAPLPVAPFTGPQPILPGGHEEGGHGEH